MDGDLVRGSLTTAVGCPSQFSLSLMDGEMMALTVPLISTTPCQGFYSAQNTLVSGRYFLTCSSLSNMTQEVTLFFPFFSFGSSEC